jgi:Zn-dependent M28 family amino/carboxypeptidase
MTFNATGKNAYAIKIGTKYPNQKFIICGHFDDMPSGALAPGADDNASGTSAVLEAARILAPLQLEYTVIFIAFDEEERGLIGSHAYADSSFNRGDSILFVFNYDMIAWDGNNDYKPI